MVDADKYYSTSTWAPGVFNGKVVFCTGGAGDICSGQVAALILLGADAAILGRRKEVTEAKARELAALRPGARVLGLSVDVRDIKSLEAAAAETVEELGRIDFVICGAAGNFLSSVDNLSANAFKTVVDIDLLGSYNTVKATLPALKKSKGRILFVSATMHYTGMPFQAHVIAAKAGVDALSDTLSIEVGPWGITSNTLAPGPIVGTEGMSRLALPGYEETLTKSVPMQRLGTIKDIADATIFLFSPAAAWITGTNVIVDGGAWRRASGMHSEFYPEALMAGTDVFTGVKGKKKAKL